MDGRDKALSRCCKLLQMAADDRTPAYERVSAMRRVRVISDRWGITEPEIRARQRLIELEQQPVAVRARRRRAVQEELMRRRRAARGVMVTFTPDGEVWWVE